MKFSFPQNSTYKIAVKILKRLEENGFESYIVGGAVRDAYLGGSFSEDLDITTSAYPEQIKQLFSKTIPVGEAFGVVIVIQNGKHFEVATFRKDGKYLDGRRPEKVEFSTVKEDVLRRDFTVNALLYDYKNQEIIDYVGGINDINTKLIRAIGNPLERFSEDKLRLLRAIRFASKLNFTIESNTYKAIIQMKKKIKEVSNERIRDEITKMLVGKNPVTSLNFLLKTGLLQEILPEVVVLKDVMQDPKYHPEGNVLIHTFKLFEFMPPNPPSELVWAALLHDVGKKPAFKIRNGRKTFYLHEVIGAEISSEILRRLKFSKDFIENVSNLIKNHMRLIHISEMKDSTFKKLLSISFKGSNEPRKFYKYLIELLKLDLLASSGDLTIYQESIRREKSVLIGREDPSRLINGNDLKNLGFKPSPLFKQILDKVFEKQLDGELKTKDEAIDFVKQNFSSTQPS